MKNTVRWDNLTSPQIKELAKQQAIVLLPVGSIEQHGPHLPVGCDSILSTAVAERAAAELTKLGKACVVAPTLTVANSRHHMNFTGTMTLTLETFVKVLQEYCECIAAHGFRKIALINGDGGNNHPAQAALVSINERLGFPVYFLAYWEGAASYLAEVLETQTRINHACEGETSLMLAVNDALVDPIYKQTQGQLTDPVLRLVPTYHRFDTCTVNGVMGNSYAASKEKGEKLVAAFVTSIVDILQQDALWEAKV